VTRLVSTPYEGKETKKWEREEHQEMHYLVHGNSENGILTDVRQLAEMPKTAIGDCGKIGQEQ